MFNKNEYQKYYSRKAQKQEHDRLVLLRNKPKCASCGIIFGGHIMNEQPSKIKTLCTKCYKIKKAS